VPIKKMSGPGYHGKLEWHAGRQLGEDAPQRIERRDLILLPVEKEDRLSALVEPIEIAQADRNADGNQPIDSLISASEAKSNDRSERETGDEDLVGFLLADHSMALEQIVEGQPGVLKLAYSVIVTARALPDSAKIEAERLVSGILERLGRAVDNLVVHGAGVEWVRMEDQRDPGRAINRLVNRFKLPVRDRNKAVALQKFHLRTLPLKKFRSGFLNVPRPGEE
jgi:hypothetical protein